MLTGSNYSQQCDIWSMGVILYLLLSGRYPFFSQDEDKLIRVICAANVDYDYIPEDVTNHPHKISILTQFILKVSFEAKDLLSKMLAKNPAVRFTASEVLQHPWTTGNVMSGAQGPANVLEMMRMWRSEMKVCAWLLRRVLLATARICCSLVPARIGWRRRMCRENQRLFARKGHHSKTRSLISLWR